MKTLPREEGSKKWDDFWNSLKEEWFKVEVLQDYSGEDHGESLSLWLEGKKEESMAVLMKQDNQEWKKALEDTKDAKKIRLHVVERPLTAYLEWEVEVYKRQNIPLGEEVYLVEKTDVIHLEIPDGDFMLFDNKKAIKNTYDKTGKCYQYDFYDEGNDISKFLHLKSELIRFAQPLKV